MKQIKNIMKDNKLLFDIINVVLGFAVIIFLIIYLKFKNSNAFFTFYILCGIMNIVNGLRYIGDPSKKKTSKNSIAIGSIIIIIGLFIQIVS